MRAPHTWVAEPATVEVDRLLCAQRGHQLGQLAEGEARIGCAATVAGQRQRDAVGDAERRARMTSLRDVRVELLVGGGEALRVEAVADDRHPCSTSSGPACSRSPRGSGGRSGRRATRRCPPSTCTQARSALQGVAKGIDSRSDAGHPHLAERQPWLAQEEPAHERLRHREPVAPRHERLRGRQDHHAHLGDPQVVGREMDRRTEAVRKLHTEGGRGRRGLAGVARQRLCPDRSHQSKVGK